MSPRLPSPSTEREPTTPELISSIMPSFPALSVHHRLLRSSLLMGSSFRGLISGRWKRRELERAGILFPPGEHLVDGAGGERGLDLGALPHAIGRRDLRRDGERLAHELGMPGVEGRDRLAEYRDVSSGLLPGASDRLRLAVQRAPARLERELRGASLLR